MRSEDRPMPETKSRQATDPVCGMEIEEEDAIARARFQGRDYFFCSDDCKDMFDENPSQYAKAG